MNIKLDKAYNYYIIISYVIYFAVLIGVFSTVPQYVVVINSFIKIVIACILLYKFNPFQQNYILSKFEKKIVFSAGIYLLLTTFVGEYLVSYQDKLEKRFKDDLIKDLDN